MTRILIVDDNVQMIEVLRRYALKEGYEVDTATDGIQALSEYEKRKYDLILLDVMMPGKDGFEVGSLSRVGVKDLFQRQEMFSCLCLC